MFRKLKKKKKYKLVKIDDIYAKVWEKLFDILRLNNFLGNIFIKTRNLL